MVRPNLPPSTEGHQDRNCSPNERVPDQRQPEQPEQPGSGDAYDELCDGDGDGENESDAAGHSGHGHGHRAPNKDYDESSQDQADRRRVLTMIEGLPPQKYRRIKGIVTTLLDNISPSDTRPQAVPVLFQVPWGSRGERETFALDGDGIVTNTRTNDVIALFMLPLLNNHVQPLPEDSTTVVDGEASAAVSAVSNASVSPNLSTVVHADTPQSSNQEVGFHIDAAVTGEPSFTRVESSASLSSGSSSRNGNSLQKGFEDRMAEAKESSDVD